MGSLQRIERATTLSPSSPHASPGLLPASNPEPFLPVVHIHVIPSNKDNQIARYQGGVRSLGGGREHGELPTLKVCTSGEPFKSNDRSAAVSHGWQGRSTEDRHRSLASLRACGEIPGRQRGLRSSPAWLCPHAAPVPPPPRRAAARAGLPPRSPALSRVLCRPFPRRGRGRPGNCCNGAPGAMCRGEPVRGKPWPHKNALLIF